MTEVNSGIDDRAIDSLSVAPGGDTAGDDAAGGASDPRQQAGQDKSIEKRLRRDPANPDAQLDRGLDESMDASDPPSATQPGDKGEPPKSSGYDEAAEAERQQNA